jgi:hypothetical protein
MNQENYSYGWQCLHLAVLVLTGEGDQKQRLQRASASHLSQIDCENDLPASIRVEFSEFIDSVSKTENADSSIKKIIHFYDHICREIGPKQ